MSGADYELELVAEAARAILGRPGGYDDPWAPVVEGGWIGVGVPENAGGQGGGMAEAVAVAQAAGRTAVAAPVVESMLVGLVVAACTRTDGLLAELGAGRQRAALVPRVVRSDQSGCVAERVHAAWARDATVIVLVAALAEGGLGVALVPRHELELELGSTLAGDPLDRIALPGNQLPSQIHELKMPLEDLIGAAGLLTAARMVGAMQTATELSIEYAGQRRQFGRSIGSFQALAHLLVEQTGRTELAVAALQAATASASTGDHAHSAAARVTASTAAPKVARIAHQVHGAIGTTQEHKLHRYTLRLAAWHDDFASTRWWMRRIGRLGFASDDWWDTLAPPVRGA